MRRIAWRAVSLLGLGGVMMACSGSGAVHGRPPLGTGGATGDASTGTGGGVGVDAALDFDAGGDAGPAGYRTDKVDLLFVIDNSSSMADKQQILAQTVPDLITRMATPDCIQTDGTRVGPSTVDGKCPTGSTPEFKAVTDIHIAVVSSSLGGHGSTEYCAPGGQGYDPSQMDMAHLLDRKAGGGTVPTYQNLAYLAWDPGNLYGGDTDLGVITSKFSDLVLGVGESGCGFEAPLESAYRFLVDPDPYESIQLSTTGTPPTAQLIGTDQTLLDQRKSFLRPDSLLAIFTITDENDCSLRDGAQYYVALQNRPLWRATSQCARDPNDPCCQSCAQTQPNTGCSAPADDPECQKTGGLYDSPLNDPINLRCFHQKERFGIDMLYPIERYVAAVENRKVVDRHGNTVDNPIYSDLQCDGSNCKPPRPRSFVFWVGIVGVPWQDIAVDPLDLTKGFMSAEELEAQGRWSVVLGDPTASPPLVPTDPLMIESVTPRTGTDPVTLGAVAPPDAMQGENPINGHEYLPFDFSDLEYACIFPLPTPRDCTQASAASCDCAVPGQPAGAIAQTQNPICQAPGTTTTDSIQRFAKAYPGTRLLEVLHGIDPAQAVVGSICPANLTDDTAPDYGYRPVVPPLMDKLRKELIIR